MDEEAIASAGLQSQRNNNNIISYITDWKNKEEDKSDR
jgi:hypothetical protein